MTTALEIISILPATKTQVDTFKAMLKKEILASADPLPALVNLKFIEKTFADVLKDDDLDAHYLKAFKTEAKDNKLTLNGASLTSQEMGGKYDYEKDHEWIKLDEQIQKLSEIKKGREKVLRENGFPKTGGKVKVITKL